MTENETIHHIIACCPKLSTSMYLPVRYNKVAKVIYDAIIDPDRTPIEEIYMGNDKEIWWDKKVTTIPPLKHTNLTLCTGTKQKINVTSTAL